MSTAPASRGIQVRFFSFCFQVSNSSSNFHLFKELQLQHQEAFKFDLFLLLPSAEFKFEVSLVLFLVLSECSLRSLSPACASCQPCARWKSSKQVGQLQILENLMNML